MSASDMRGRNKEVPDVAALIRATVLSASASGSAKSLLLDFLSEDQARPRPASNS
jgi:hypothetical protein